MNVPQFIKKNQIRGQELATSAFDYLIKTFKQAYEMFTYSTAYGQIMLVTMNLFKINNFYVSDSITELNMHTAQRRHSVFGNAQVQGHNALRGRSATGEVKLAVKDANTNLVGDYIYITNYTRLKCKNNDLYYLLELGQDVIPVNIKNPSTRRIKIIEGELETQIFTGTGESLQTYEVTSPANKFTDDEFVLVEVNNERIKKYISFYDIPFGEPGCLIKTGLNNGIAVQFATKTTTRVPQLGEEIRVDYLLTKGRAGNIPTKHKIVWEFADDGYDINGLAVNINDFLEVSTELAPNFGADEEDMELTKLLAPNISRNFIIHDARSIKYFLGRMNFFSSIKVYQELTENVNQFDVIAVPRITDRLGVNDDYFTVDIDKFTLTELEGDRILNMMDEAGNKSANIALRFVKPTLRRFSAVIYLDVFDLYKGNVVTDEQIDQEVRDTLNELLIANKRINKLPHSDVVKVLDQISFVDTVKVVFISPDGTGIDNMGNISVPENHMVLLRGGFTDQDGVQYEDGYNFNSELMGAVTIVTNKVSNFNETFSL